MADDNGWGALPPTPHAWQIDKTAATIAFVKEAEAAFTTRSDLTETEAYQLRTHVEMLKEGQTSLIEFETVDEWLDRLRDHYP